MSTICVIVVKIWAISNAYRREFTCRVLGKHRLAPVKSLPQSLRPANASLSPFGLAPLTKPLRVSLLTAQLNGGGSVVSRSANPKGLSSEANPKGLSEPSTLRD